MTSTTTQTTSAVLKTILAVDPQASLDKIRAAHPVFRAMSLDQLGLRLSRAIEAEAASWAK